MAKTVLTEDTIVAIGKGIPLYKYRDFFIAATGKDIAVGFAFQSWLNTQTGKTLKDALVEFRTAATPKTLSELLAEPRFSYVADVDKAFCAAFDAAIAELGYDFGGSIGEGYVWGKNQIVYKKSSTKATKVVARIFLRDGSIVLRMFFSHIDKHRAYIESAPEHIKTVFTSAVGDCSCDPKKPDCRMRKTYTLNGRLIEKCSGVVFEFHDPTTEKLTDYLGLLAEFYAAKGAQKK